MHGRFTIQGTYLLVTFTDLLLPSTDSQTSPLFLLQNSAKIITVSPAYTTFLIGNRAITLVSIQAALLSQIEVEGP